ncbi:MAG TPA: hypothetical protein PKI49_15105 [Pseudomonadota bacterium]|jgi:hypothetical protein|nr:hypothetical protein [Pseudomonadota bacterium]HND10314.1 hypothetical protein [Pseudomonadota bacterium]HNG00059.1 hypothetical protein [Pseudomonadota bacterium]HNI60584.1 hypothetical protein [Pseudomonadota bacterium]HNK46251.1 hypothetical protein [Pseudomonadota bacterium]
MPGSQHVPGRASSLPIAPVDQAVDGATDYASTEGEDSAFLLCRKLRSKLAFAQVESSDGEHVSAIDALQGTAVYWCLSTMECAGPDGGLAHQSVCRSDRGCYKSRV